MEKLPLRRGASAVITVTLNDNVFTGKTLYMTLKKAFHTFLQNDTDQNAEFQKTITTFETSNSALVPITSTDSDLPPGKYRFDFALVDGSGNVEATDVAILEILPRVTALDLLDES